MNRGVVVGLVLAGVLVSGVSEPVLGQDARRVTLDEALNLARRHSPTLEQAQSAVEIAEFNRLNAWGQFLPDLSLSYQYNNSSSGRLDPTGQQITTTSYSAQLGGSLDLFQGFRRFADLKGANLGVDLQNARYRQSEYVTQEAVKISYFNAVATRELVRVEQDRVRRQEDQLSFVEQQLELGRATRSDLLRSQVDLNNAKVALLNAENSARNAQYALAEAVGLGEPLEPEPAAEMDAAPFTWDKAELMTMAMAGAPGLVSARAQAEADQAAVASAKSAYLPSLRFNGGWAWANSEFPPQNRSWAVSLSGSYPLFNGFSRENQLYTAKARADQSRSAERAEDLRLRKDIDGAYGTTVAAQASRGLAEQTVDLSREDLRVSQERYRLGLATILDLQSAQITLLEAEVNLIRAQFDYQLGLARLEALLGTDLR